MSEKRMKTSVNTGEVSLHPAHKAGWGVKVLAEHHGGSEKHSFGVEIWLEKPGDGKIIAKMIGKT
jgi:hypothetical protein